MVKLEDRQFEDYIIETSSHIAMPFELHMKSDGEIEIISYSFTQKIAEEFEKKFASDPFSDEARHFLCEKLTPTMNELGYDTEGAADRIHLEYRCSEADTTKILPECEIISTLQGEQWDELPLDEFSLDPDDKTDRMAVIREGGKIVCFAGLNDISEDDGYIEVTVECCENYRHRGFGVSCIAALTDYLLSLGERVKYICVEDNYASRAAAESAGFVLYDRCMPFVCYRHLESECAEEPEEELI
ncbi:MAG: GNAT family N-acetyltransferase [Eubacteriales bacterium]